jgi:hypothetical protein
MPSPIHKLKTKTAGGTLSLEVVKSKATAVVTSAHVGSTGTDDKSFDDKQLTSGTASMPLNANNSYSVVWMGAFLANGSAELQVVVKHADGRPPSKKQIKVNGKLGDKFWRLVIVP